MRYRLRRFVTAAIIAACAAGGLALPVFQASPASASTRLGGVSVEGWCQFAWGYHAYIAYWSAWGWRCNPVPNNSYYKVLDKSVDMNGACRLQYGNGAWASASDAGNPYSWSCYH
jgi:hypothetical protein